MTWQDCKSCHLHYWYWFEAFSLWDEHKKDASLIVISIVIVALKLWGVWVKEEAMEFMNLSRLQTYVIKGQRREHGIYLWMLEKWKRCKVGIRWQSQMFIQRERRVEGQKGVFLPLAIIFAIKVEKMAMDDVTPIVDYENIKKCTMAENLAKLQVIFCSNYK